MDSFNYGNIIVDDDGIRRRSLPLIGKGFRFAWDELISWKSSKSLLPSTDTGKPEPISILLELNGPTGAESVDRRTAGDMLDALVAYLRLRCPDKETKSESEPASAT